MIFWRYFGEKIRCQHDPSMTAHDQLNSTCKTAADGRGSLIGKP